MLLTNAGAGCLEGALEKMKQIRNLLAEVDCGINLLQNRWHPSKMTRILYVILTIITISSCSQKIKSTEITDNFSEGEIKDLHKLTDFFQVQMCGSTSDFKSCIDSIIPILGEYGWNPILENVDFDAQNELYSEFQSDLFSEIWNFCPSRNRRGNQTYRLLCLNRDGKYVQFLKDLSQRNPDLKEYYEMTIESGDWESRGQLHSRIYTNPQYYDLEDPSIKVLIAVQYLTQNDQEKRKESWVEN